MSLIARLREYRDSIEKTNPCMVDKLEATFPELIDNTPYIYINQLFFLEKNPGFIYQLIKENYTFKIRNIGNNKDWKGELTKQSEEEEFLTRIEFRNLLAQSNIKIKRVIIVTKDDLTHLYNQII